MTTCFCVDWLAVFIASATLFPVVVGGAGVFWVLWKHYPRSGNPYLWEADPLPEGVDPFEDQDVGGYDV